MTFCKPYYYPAMDPKISSILSLIFGGLILLYFIYKALDLHSLI
jgi:hypothetical protein